MILVGVLLIVLAALFVAGFMLEPGGSTEAEFFGLILPNLSARTLVLLGVVLGLLVAFGYSLIRSGVVRWSQRRRARRAAAATPVNVDDLGATTPLDPFTAPSPEAR